MRLSPELSEWLNLLARWFHVFAAILWVGSTFYFTWLDGRFQEEERAAREEGGDPEVWMVHSGGFYVVGKRKTPSLKRLHWFRWEAASTWLSGMVLLTLVYYHGGAMVDVDVRDIGAWAAGGFGIGMLVVGWIVYDLLLRSPLGRNEKGLSEAAKPSITPTGRPATWAVMFAPSARASCTPCIRRRQRLGSVGATGNARSVGCHLHFELRGRGGPLDPLPRLRAWDRFS